MVIAPASFNFGKVVATASSKVHKFTATNKSKAPAHLGTLAALLPPSFTLSLDKCTNQTLTPKGTKTDKCTVDVAFTPTTVTAVPLTEMLTVPYDNASTATAKLEGTGIGPTAKRAPTSVTFGKTTGGGISTAIKKVTITNSSAGASIVLSTLLAPIMPNFAIVKDFCAGATLTAKGTAGAKCVVTTRFTPLAGTAAGTKLSAVLSYSFSLVGNPPAGTLTATLKGTAK